MSDDWQKGDLALCVAIFPNDHGFGNSPDLRVGAVYSVSKVVWARDMYGRVERGLAFPDVRPIHPKAIAHNAGQFRKIPKHEADDFDREVTDAMTGAPSETIPFHALGNTTEVAG